VLHASLLMRYSMLVTGLRRFCDDLEKTVPEVDRNRCRDLLTNVDFVLMIAGQDDPGLRRKTRLYRVNLFVSLAALPVAVMLALQISFLRYQSEAITRTQQVVLAADLLMLVIFYYGLWRRTQRPRRSRRLHDRVLRVASYSVLPLLILIINLSYFGVPDASARTVRYYDWLKYYDWRNNNTPPPWWHWQRLATQPLDLVVCPNARWGCRYLDLSNRALVGKTASNAIEELRTRPENINKALSEFDALSARNRTLRFANFNQARAYAIDLVGSDLRQASFWSASLQGAKFSYAHMEGANLELAQLQQADLNWAHLKGASLVGAQLQGATMLAVDLQGADLTKAQLQGAELAAAKLQGADLTSANLSAADLREASLSQLTFDNETSFDVADMRRINSTTEISDQERDIIRSSLASYPGRLQVFLKRLDAPRLPLSELTVANAILVAKVDVSSDLLRALHAANKLLIDAGEQTSKAHFYDNYVTRLAAYAADDPAVAAGLAQRATAVVKYAGDRAVYVVFACRLLDPAVKGSLQLSARQVAQLKGFRAACPSADATRPGTPMQSPTAR
jgi:uncharacterized protein YjbI with pentapeptide repeats